MASCVNNKIIYKKPSPNSKKVYFLKTVYCLYDQWQIIFKNTCNDLYI